MNVASIPIEYFTIATVFKLLPSLRKQPAVVEAPINSLAGVQSHLLIFGGTMQYLKSLLSSLPFYFRHPAVYPSFALALLYLTVLSFSGQMIAFLLFSGCTSAIVGAIRTISTVFELSATWIAPRLMRKIGPVRSGIWFLNWQMLSLAAGVRLFRTLKGSIPAASALVVGVILSRVGLWGFDLSVQTIIQDEVDENFRGKFSTTEASFQNLFELLSYVTTLVFPHPNQFRWPVIISAIAVYAAGGLYAFYVRQRRGHLLHLNNLVQGKEWHPSRQRD